MGASNSEMESSHLLRPELGPVQVIKDINGISRLYEVLNRSYFLQAMAETYALSRQQQLGYLLGLCYKRSVLSDSLHSLVPILYYRIVQQMCGSHLEILYEYVPVTLQDVVRTHKQLYLPTDNKHVGRDGRLNEVELLAITKAVVKAVLALQNANLGWGWIEPTDIRRRTKIVTSCNSLASMNNSIMSQSSSNSGLWQETGWQWLIMHSPVGFSCNVGELGPNLQQILLYCTDQQGNSRWKYESYYSDKMKLFIQQSCYYDARQLKHILNVWYQSNTLPEIQNMPSVNRSSIKKRSVRLKSMKGIHL